MGPLLEAVETKAVRRGCGKIFIEDLPENQQAYCLGVGYKFVNEAIYPASGRTASFEKEVA